MHTHDDLSIAAWTILCGGFYATHENLVMISIDDAEQCRHGDQMHCVQNLQGLLHTGCY